MPRDTDSLIQKGSNLLGDVLEVVADVRERAESADEQHRGAPKRIVSSEEVEATGEDISVLSSEELHARLLIALTEVTDVGEEFARRKAVDSCPNLTRTKHSSSLLPGSVHPIA